MHPPRKTWHDLLKNQTPPSLHSPMAKINPAEYLHSPIHQAVLSRNHSALTQLLSSIPPLISPPHSQTLTESESIAEEAHANAISALIDRRDVPQRETPLHLAIKLGDAASVDLLLAAGADSSLQNALGWSPLQESICAREEAIAKIILRHYQASAWVKWRRRMPRVVAAMRRMRDFYMEIDFRFESSVIPFVSRIAPSDTYKIWKRGADLRADMTIRGFDGLRIKRAEQSVLFLGGGSGDGKAKAGSLLVVSHEDREVLDALDGAGGVVSDEELREEVAALLRGDVLRPGIDVTRAVLLPRMNWRKQQRSEMIGGVWKAKVYDLHHVVVSVKSRRVRGGAARDDGEEEEAGFGDMITEEERRRLEAALKMEISDAACFDEESGQKHDVEKKDLGLKEGSSKVLNKEAWNAIDGSRDESKRIGESLENGRRCKENGRENEYRKGLKPVLWLSSDFPLQTEELLPLLDILANKVKAIRRLRELLTTKLPSGTFPVKVAIPVIPTVRVLVSFTKFEELQSRPPEVFCTHLSTPERESPLINSANWAQWLISSYSTDNFQSKESPEHGNYSIDLQDPFTIPPNYEWTTSEAKKKKKKIQEASGKLKKRQG